MKTSRLSVCAVYIRDRDDPDVESSFSILVPTLTKHDFPSCAVSSVFHTVQVSSEKARLRPQTFSFFLSSSVSFCTETLTFAVSAAFISTVFIDET